MRSPRQRTAAASRLVIALVLLTAGLAGLGHRPAPAGAVVQRVSGYRATVLGWSSWYGSYGLGADGTAWCIDHGIRAPDPALRYVRTTLTGVPAATQAAMAWAFGRHGTDPDRTTAAALMLVGHDLMGARYPYGRMDVDALTERSIAGFGADGPAVLARARAIRADAVAHSGLRGPWQLTVTAPRVAPGARGTGDRAGHRRRRRGGRHRRHRRRQRRDGPRPHRGDHGRRRCRPGLPHRGCRVVPAVRLGTRPGPRPPGVRAHRRTGPAGGPSRHARPPSGARAGAGHHDVDDLDARRPRPPPPRPRTTTTTAHRRRPPRPPAPPRPSPPRAPPPLPEVPPASVPPPVPTAPPATTSTSTSTTTPTTPPAPPPPALPRTGAAVGPLASTGAGLVLLGTSLPRPRRRPRVK